MIILSVKWYSKARWLQRDSPPELFTRKTVQTRSGHIITNTCLTFQWNLQEWHHKLESDWTMLTVPNAKQQNKSIPIEIGRSLGQTLYIKQTICSTYRYQLNADHNRTAIIINRVMYFATVNSKELYQYLYGNSNNKQSHIH